MLTHIGALARLLLPANTVRGRAARTAALPIIVWVRRARVRAQAAREAGPLSYRDFLRLQQPALDVPPSDYSFVVLLELTSDKRRQQVLDTRRSVAQQMTRTRVVEVASGAPLAEALDGVDEDFVLFVRPGDTLRSGALSVVGRLAQSDPSLQLIGFDTDEGGSNPQFRPEWSPEILLGANYLGRGFAARTAWLRAAPDVEITSRGIWRLLLSIDPLSTRVGRVPHVLLSESVPTETPASPSDAAMVKEALAARGETATTSVRDGIVRVQFQPDVWPTVSIVIPTRHSRANLSRLLPSLATTEYDGFDVTIVDNGEESDENRQWYARHDLGFPLTVRWWSERPFNYSKVNNDGIRSTSGEVVVMLNDDTEIVDPGWLAEMVGMLQREGVGTVGMQLRSDDLHIQHAGVLLGPGGFADNLFSGLRPGSRTYLGRSTWYRDSLAVTGACVAVKRADFEDVGGLDERFILTGSDVVLGLDQVIRGRRNAVIPFDMVRHFESLTRGTEVPRPDFFASYWRYHPWIQGGDPYSSPNLSRQRPIPTLRRPTEPPAVRLALEAIGRPYRSTAQGSSFSEDAKALLRSASVSREDVDAIAAAHAEIPGRREVRTVNWFVPDIDMPFFGGFNTMFRIADKLAREHGVMNRFVVMTDPNPEFFLSALVAAFPALAGSDVRFYDGSDESIAAIPGADAAIATLWLTALHVAKAKGIGRKFYLMQDYEPNFYPASTLFAMAEQSYRLGLYAICNTVSMHTTYTQAYGGRAMYFTPAVDREIYHPAGRRHKAEDEPVTIFAYARDHFRNCWELVYAGLAEIKRMHGDRVRIVVAGARYLPPTADFVDLGLLDYRATGALYRDTDIGITMQVSRHPSYLPLELMASGAAMVVPTSEWFSWLFTDHENSVRSMGTVADVVAGLDELVRNAETRRRIAAAGIATIDESHSDWDVALEGIYDYLADPENLA